MSTYPSATSAPPRPTAAGSFHPRSPLATVPTSAHSVMKPLTSASPGPDGQFNAQQVRSVADEDVSPSVQCSLNIRPFGGVNAATDQRTHRADAYAANRSQIPIYAHFASTAD